MSTTAIKGVTRVFLQRQSDQKFLVWIHQDHRFSDDDYVIQLPGGEKVSHPTMSWEQMNKIIIRYTIGVRINCQTWVTTISVDGQEYHFYVATFIGTPLGKLREYRWVNRSSIINLLRRKHVVLERGMDEALRAFSLYRRRMKRRTTKITES